MDVESSVRDINERIKQATAQKARAEVQRENALGSLSKAKEKLKTEFGVQTPEEAKKVLTELESELHARIVSAQEALKRTEK